MTTRTQVILLSCACLLVLVYAGIREWELLNARAKDKNALSEKDATPRLKVSTNDVVTAGVVGPEGNRADLKDAAQKALLELEEKWEEAFKGGSGLSSEEREKEFLEFLESCRDLSAAEFVDLATGYRNDKVKDMDISLLTVAVKLDGAMTFALMDETQLATYGPHLFATFYEKDPTAALSFLEGSKGQILGQLPWRQIALAKMKDNYEEGLQDYVAAGGALWNLKPYLKLIGQEAKVPELTVELVEEISDQQTRMEKTRELISNLIKQDEFENFQATLVKLYPTASLQRDQLFNWRTWQQVDSGESATALLDLSYDRERSAFGITDQWAREDRFLEDAGAWVTSLKPGAEREAARRGFLERIRKRDEALADEWARRLE